MASLTRCYGAGFYVKGAAIVSWALAFIPPISRKVKDPASDKIFYPNYFTIFCLNSNFKADSIVLSYSEIPALEFFYDKCILFMKVNYRMNSFAENMAIITDAILP